MLLLPKKNYNAVNKKYVYYNVNKYRKRLNELINTNKVIIEALVKSIKRRKRLYNEYDLSIKAVDKKLNDVIEYKPALIKSKCNTLILETLKDNTSFIRKHINLYLNATTKANALVVSANKDE